MIRTTVMLALTAIVLVGCGPSDRGPGGTPSSDILTKDEQAALTPDAVIADLREGNERFVTGRLTDRDYLAQARATAGGQFPKAAVLSCLDSRVPVEIVMDQGIGDLFVGRVAGNVEDEAMIGSFEFATSVAGAKLVVVLGHSACGAVKGSIDREAVKPLGLDNLNDLLDHINPAVEASLQAGEERTSGNKELVDRAIRQNVVLTMERIRERSPDLKAMEEAGTIRIVGGVYDLTTGRITWI